MNTEYQYWFPDVGEPNI